jgi:hypothetical protein
MPFLLSDTEIAMLIAEPKNLKISLHDLLQLKQRSGHKGKEVDVRGDNGSKFRIILRQNDFNKLDFSAILGFYPPKTSELFRLRRYNGKSHEHKNRIEGNKMYDFHIHYATERYQQLGCCEDTYAEASNKYTDLQTAVKCLVTDCGFHFKEQDQLSIFSIKP